jgi:hypothetical protein
MEFIYFNITPKTLISEKGYIILTGQVDHYEIIAFPPDKRVFYPLQDIVLNLN